jgi:hypothetical protein
MLKVIIIFKIRGHYLISNVVGSGLVCRDVRSIFTFNVPTDFLSKNLRKISNMNSGYQPWHLFKFGNDCCGP